MTATAGARRLLLVLGAIPLLAVLVTGCGIRSTEVPTDFGAAPSRVPCALSGPDLTTQSSRGVPAQIFLVCGSQLVTVERTVTIPSGKPESDRVRVAQALLDELAETPTAPERQAGYSTSVRDGMTVTSRRGDPPAALRLSIPPEDLTSYALAQLVCTLADSSAASDDGSVTLGGPGSGAVRRYECTHEARSRPGTDPVPSTEVGAG